ncbi:MAG: molybdopterin-dependent oxidoreductase, partial [Verrucomicrobiae bacterium]|nr:molybdopterin-dependent oxidoreductase [Verrucomicrobiae bacterium]
STARFDHAATLTALRQFFGVGAATASFADIDDATCLVIAGADPDASHPVLASRIRQSVAKGAALIVIDPRRTALAAQADLHLAVPPDEVLALFEATASRLTQQGLHHTPPTDADRLASALLRHRGSTVFLPGTGLSEVATIGTFLRLAHLTGNLGRKGAGVLPFGGQNNLQGCWDAGAAPELLPGQRDISDAEARARIEDLWGRCLPEERGFTLPEMISAIQEKRLRAMWVLGNDPSQRLGGDALKPLDLLVVQDLFYSDTSRHAHVLLPAASAFEQSGVFINAERRAQLIRPALPPSEEARPDWAILTVMARRLGAEWPYLDAAQVFAELSLVAPDLFAGITHRRLEESSDGLQWPCPDEDHPGTPTLPIDSR